MTYEDIVGAQSKRNVKEATKTYTKTAGRKDQNLPRIEAGDHESKS